MVDIYTNVMDSIWNSILTPVWKIEVVRNPPPDMNIHMEVNQITNRFLSVRLHNEYEY